ncbi:MAG: ADP-ribosylglycohydrolase family protein [Oculatellaceae cyanobacterium bins.114]|nr:ADP-ribosylglycohydrolase family protein [Oculatellaceae cyanobacterium bins.114]
MHYSLQSRFRGALLGAALGEVLGFQCQAHRHPKSSSLSWQRLEQWGLHPLEIMPSWSYGRTIVSGLQQLIKHQRWDVATSQLKAVPTLNGTAPPEKSCNLWDQSIAQHSPPASLIVTLPIALYFHDDLPQLRYQVQQAIAVWHPTPDNDEVQLAALISAYAIALALRHQANLHTSLVADLIDDLELSQHRLEWVKILTQVTDLVAQGRGLLSILRTLGHPDKPGSAMTGVAIALGCVLNTPDDFRLSVLQAARLPYHPQWVCALVGAFAGAFNGMAGLPLQWRSALHRHPAQSSALMALWDVKSEAMLVQLADQLLAVWGGIDQASTEFPGSAGVTRNSSPYRVIAAPDVIRPR